MPMVLNALDKEQTTVVGGNHFTFGPGQMKYFSNAHIAENIAKMRKDEGFVLLPESVDHLGLLKPEQLEKVITQEDKDVIAQAKREGIENYCRRLRELLHNATISLQKDLDMKNIKADARIYMTSKDVDRMKDLAKYQKNKQDSEQRRLDEIKELEKAIGPMTRG